VSETVAISGVAGRLRLKRVPNLYFEDEADDYAEDILDRMPELKTAAQAMGVPLFTPV
jgi:hypothetical protein